LWRTFQGRATHSPERGSVDDQPPQCPVTSERDCVPRSGISRSTTHSAEPFEKADATRQSDVLRLVCDSTAAGTGAAVMLHDKKPSSSKRFYRVMVY